MTEDDTTGRSERESNSRSLRSPRAGTDPEVSDREQIRVLLVEDNPGDAKLIELALRKHGEILLCHHAERFAEACEFLKTNEVEIVLLDLDLPDARGMDVVVGIQNVAPEARIIVLTGNQDTQASIRAINLGADDYLLKGDIDSHKLFRSVRYSVARLDADRYREELTHSKRLAALGQISAGIAHELNNPMSFILANLEFLNEDLNTLVEQIDVEAHGKLLDQMRQSVSDAFEGAERIQRLVQDISLYVRFDVEPSSENWLNPILENAAKHTEGFIKERADLEVSLTDDPFIVADSMKLEQVFVNLLRNAVESISPDDPAGKVILRSQIEDDHACVEVEDNGEGISRQHQRTIFEPFYTTKAKGTGIGLSIVARIVEAHHGTIEVDSAPERGTTFRVKFPLASPADASG